MCEADISHYSTKSLQAKYLKLLYASFDSDCKLLNYHWSIILKYTLNIK